jgi:hypothetical protein
MTGSFASVYKLAGALYLVIKPEHEEDNSTTPTSNNKSAWNFTSTSTYAFML